VGRRERGFVDDIMDIATASPPIGAAIGAAFCVAAIYTQWINPRGMYGLNRVLAMLFWLLAVLALVVSGVSFVRQKLAQRKRFQRLDRQRSIEDLRRLSFSEFEEVIADFYRRQGYKVEECGGPGDGGIDLILRRDGSAEHLVQCKRYASWKVGPGEMRDFFGAMAGRATRCEGIFITCGEFSEDARAFAAGKPIRLIDGLALLSMFAAMNPLAPAVSTYTGGFPAAAPPVAAAAGSPLCPCCRVAMERRIARRGSNAGRPFWGCQNYPRCREIVDGD